MSDMAVDFRLLKTHSQVKRQMNRENSTARLAAEGVPFVVKNNGAHLIVDGAWDFYPGTGKFKHRTLPIEGRGVRNFLNRIKDIAE